MAVDPDPTQVMTTEEPTQEMPQQPQATQQMDDNFQYEQFQVQERLGLVRQRLRELESQHYNKKLDMYVAKEGSGQADNLLEEAATIEANIMELRQEEQSVVAEQPQQEPPA